MKKNSKGLQYGLDKAKNLYMFYTVIALGVLVLISGIIAWIENKEFPSDIYIYVPFLLMSIFYVLYAKYSKIKRKILSRYGVRHDAEIVKAKYVKERDRWGAHTTYYLEIDFTNRKGKKKTLYTPGYHGNPNYYLKSADCCVYEWKGFYVEDDLQLRDEIEYFGYAGIPTEERHFIWR